MQRRGHLIATLAHAPFRRLYSVRLTGQFADGVFQAGLAGAVLFNPERQAHAADVAAGFAVLLIPYSLVGPFAGVLLDRWWRQRVLVGAGFLRAACVLAVAAALALGLHGQPLFACALVVVSINRFFLATLSASLPHVVRPDDLVTANAFSTTCGTVATTLGGALAIGVRAVMGGGTGSYALVTATAAVPYAIAAVTAIPFPRPALGPDDVERDNRETAGAIARGLLAGARHIAARRPARYALTAIGVHRLAYGVTTVSTLLLYRNYFHGSGVLRAGLGGLAQVVAVVAVGGALAALVTPTATRGLGHVRWQVALLLLSAAATVGLGLPYRLPLMLVGAFVLGFAAQGIKISVDTLVQRTIADEFRGRVFSLYDALFNLALVVAAGLTAVVLPENGHAPVSVVVIAGVYLVTAAGYLQRATRLRTGLSTSPATP